MNTPISFELSKELKEKGFDKESLHFYTKPRCKMLSVDEHGRYYSIVNTPKKLYIIGTHYVTNDKNIYYAPTIAEVVCWIYNKYDIWISLIPDSSSGYRLLNRKFSVSIFRFNMNLNVQVEIIRKNKDILYFNLPENAFDYAINYTIKNLIQ